MEIVPPDYLELSDNCTEFLLSLFDTRCRDFVLTGSFRLRDAIVSLVCSTSLIYVFLSKVHCVESVLLSYNTLVHNKRHNTFIATKMADMRLIYRYNIQQEMRSLPLKVAPCVPNKNRETLSTSGGTWNKGITHIKKGSIKTSCHTCAASCGPSLSLGLKIRTLEEHGMKLTNTLLCQRLGKIGNSFPFASDSGKCVVLGIVELVLTSVTLRTLHLT